MERILLVSNSQSGLTQKDQSIVDGIIALQSAGFEVVEATIEQVSSVQDFARKLKEVAPKTVVACGGDGTVNMLAGHLVGTEIRLAVVPIGTFNHFAKHIGIGTDVAEAFKTVTTGDTIDIDTAEVNGHTFVNFSTVGFYARLIRRRETYQKQAWKKWPAFVASLYDALVGYSPLSLHISKGDALVEVKTPLVFVGNNLFDFGSLDVLAGRQGFSQGKLQLSIAAEMGRWGIFSLALRSMLFDIKNSPGFTTVALDEVQIDARQSKITVSLDGEITTMETPLLYKNRPRSLKVIVPRPPS